MLLTIITRLSSSSRARNLIAIIVNTCPSGLSSSDYSYRVCSDCNSYAEALARQRGARINRIGPRVGLRLRVTRELVTITAKD